MAMSKRATEKLAADRSALANNWIFANRKAIISWANANGHGGLTFKNKADAYAHAMGKTAEYQNAVDSFTKVELTYYKDSELTLANLLA